MAQVVISNVDESVKQNFERFCANTGVNMTRAFSALVDVAIGLNNQGLLLNTTREAQRQVTTIAQRQTDALDTLLAELNATDETLTEGFDEILSQGVNIRGISL